MSSRSRSTSSTSSSSSNSSTNSKSKNSRIFDLCETKFSRENPNIFKTVESIKKHGTEFLDFVINKHRDDADYAYLSTEWPEGRTLSQIEFAYRLYLAFPGGEFVSRYPVPGFCSGDMAVLMGNDVPKESSKSEYYSERQKSTDSYHRRPLDRDRSPVRGSRRRDYEPRRHRGGYDGSPRRRRYDEGYRRRDGPRRSRDKYDEPRKHRDVYDEPRKRREKYDEPRRRRDVYDDSYRRRDDRHRSRDVYDEPRNRRDEPSSLRDRHNDQRQYRRHDEQPLTEHTETRHSEEKITTHTENTSESKEQRKEHDMRKRPRIIEGKDIEKELLEKKLQAEKLKKALLLKREKNGSTAYQ